ncbi:MAG: hypothetical protein E6R04_08570 [Spirochaetes bacterium]|nr:MAG: hypothetical protein E6R04_08570 [Spirochaetota bacterium]
MSRITDRKRSARQRDGGTLYAKLLSQGFTAEQLQERVSAVPPNRQFTVTVLESTDGSDPVVGVAYGGDYRYEEERGQEKISELLTNGGTGDLTHIRGGEVYRAYAFDTDGNNEYRSGSFDERFADAYRCAKRRRNNGGKSVGEFHDGKVLVILPDADDTLAHAVLTHLFTDTSADGALRYGGTSNPFSRASVFYDERDLSVETMDAIRADEKFTADAMKSVAKVNARLSKGKYLYFLGNPRFDSKKDAAVFWLNSSFDHHYGASSFGWFTLEELESLADKIGV